MAHLEDEMPPCHSSTGVQRWQMSVFVRDCNLLVQMDKEGRKGILV